MAQLQGEKTMRRSKGGNDEGVWGMDRKRVLARVLAADLRCVRGGEEILPDSTITDPPPGRDMTFVGADGETF
jgi:hypothetical protein